MLERDGSVGQNHGKRGFQLVRGIGDELALRSPRLLDRAQRPAREEQRYHEKRCERSDCRTHERKRERLPAGGGIGVGEREVRGVTDRSLFEEEPQVREKTRAVFCRGKARERGFEHLVIDVGGAGGRGIHRAAFGVQRIYRNGNRLALASADFGGEGPALGSVVAGGIIVRRGVVAIAGIRPVLRFALIVLLVGVGRACPVSAKFVLGRPVVAHFPVLVLLNCIVEGIGDGLLNFCDVLFPVENANRGERDRNYGQNAHHIQCDKFLSQFEEHRAAFRASTHRGPPPGGSPRRESFLCARWLQGSAVSCARTRRMLRRCYPR